MKSEGKMEQPKNQSQELAMARRSLRKAKEMDLTPEQKVEIMSLIKQAKSLEKSDPGQALKLYNQLKKKLEDIKSEANGEMEDDPEKIKRQLAILDNEITNVKNMLKTPLASDYYVNEFKALNSQRNTIIQSIKMKTNILPDEDVKIDTVKIFKEKEIWRLIEKEQKWPDDYLFLIRKAVDKEGNLLYLNLGVLINPEIEYVYRLKGSFGRFSSSSSISIDKSAVNIESGEVENAENIADYDEEIQEWGFYSDD